MVDRLLFDISTSARWIGPPVGIVRVERELAKWALNNQSNCRFVFFDGNLQSYREIDRCHLASVLEGKLSVDTTGMRDPPRSRLRKTDRVPRSLLAPFLWLTQTRRMIRRTLGAIQLQTRPSTLKEILNHIYTFNNQHTLVGLDAIAGKPIHLEPGDRIFFAGTNWAYSNATYVAEQKKQMPVKLITLCYDAIPLLFPQYFKTHDVKIIEQHFKAAFHISSLILVTSKIVAEDVRKYCEAKNILVRQVSQIPLGFDLPTQCKLAGIPAQVRKYSRYIMFVSTIEPRKGHQLAQAVWTRLLREGIPQELDVGLVLVGRPGWMVDDLMKSLLTCDRIEILDNAEDQELAALYTDAAFCIYPSKYEGYGLPIVEALARGKAVLSSNVGFVPELEAQSLKRLPPADEDAWYNAIQEWLVHPPRTSEAFQLRHPTWQQAAAQVFTTIYENS